MMFQRNWGAAVAAMALLCTACHGTSGSDATSTAATVKVPVTIQGAGGKHVFLVETARTEDEQKQGLMYRTDIPEDGGMLFAPYPPQGGAGKVASFWMKNTPTPLDILFIRADGTIAHIAENTIPFSTDPVGSGEPVTAVLELKGGKAADAGISEGDKVSWPK
jgi:uncharacterized protein